MRYLLETCFYFFVSFKLIFLGYIYKINPWFFGPVDLTKTNKCLTKRLKLQNDIVSYKEQLQNRSIYDQIPLNSLAKEQHFLFGMVWISIFNSTFYLHLHFKSSLLHIVHTAD